MKVIGQYLFFLVMMIGLAVVASATVTIHKTSFTTSYFSGEDINGTVNLTLDDVLFDSLLTSSAGDSMALEKFLDDNGASYTCEPFDCSNSYETLGSAAASKAISMTADTDHYLGFVVTGENVKVTGFDMNFSSTFGKGTMLPLELEFFEDTTWKFSQFSNEYSAKNWGCYTDSAGSTGPFIKSSQYCQLINLSETAAIKAGARVNAYTSGEKNLRMNLYPIDGGFSLGSCTFDASVTDNCSIQADAGDTFSEDRYQVCVSADNPTNYQLYEETTGGSCGFVYALGPSNSVKDYAVFAQTALFENASFLDKDDMNLDELISQADAIVEYRYNRNCTEGCVLPIRAKGAAQTLTASDLSLDVIIDGEDQVGQNINELKILPATLDYTGLVDLSLTGFKANTSGVYTLSIGGQTLFSRTITITPSPIITGLSPLNPPAGIPVTFSAGVSYSGNKPLSYEWDFGDGLTQTTNEGKVEHAYAALGNYTIKITVSTQEATPLSSSKSFAIDAVSPKEAVNTTLREKTQQLNQTLNSLQGFPTWYQDELKDFAKLSELQASIASIEQENSNAVTDEQFLSIAKKLYALDIPLLFLSEKEIGVRLLSDKADINPLPVSQVAGGVAKEYIDEYKSPIINWQGLYMNSIISTDIISVVMENGEKTPILRVYHLDLTSTDETGPGYFVINNEKKNLIFNDANTGTAAQESEGSTVVTLEPNQRQVFSFYNKYDVEPTSFFAAPKLSLLVIEAAIDTSCNYNLVCEEGLGENSKTCRNDCKPTTGIIVLSVIAFFIILILYTLLQLWYQYLYEKHLFGDRNQLFNILMYIHNARARQVTYHSIEKELRKQGWSAERTNYAIKKARGKNTGLPQIIPFSKIAARRRKKKALKQQEQARKQREQQAQQTQQPRQGTVAQGSRPMRRPMPRRRPMPMPKAPIQRGRPRPGMQESLEDLKRIATGNQQQPGRKINKSGMQQPSNKEKGKGVGQGTDTSQGS